MLHEEERSAPAQRHEWNSSGEHEKVAGIVDAMEAKRRLEVSVEGEQTVPDF